MQGNYFTQVRNTPSTLNSNMLYGTLQKSTNKSTNKSNNKSNVSNSSVIEKSQSQMAAEQERVPELCPQRPSLITPRVKTPILDFQIERISYTFKQSILQMEEKINGPITERAMDKTKSIVMIQRAYKMHLAKKLLKQKKEQARLAREKQQRYRRSIVEELVLTERDYLKAVTVLCMVQQDLKEMAPRPNRILGSAEIKGLFQNIDAIKGLSNEMMIELEKKFTIFDETTKIGEMLMQFAMFFKFYFEYCNNYTSSCKLYNQLKKENKAFSDYILKFQLDHLKGTLFESYMIKPVQRVPKYVLLLKDLLKNTNPSHPDYNDLKRALDQFIRVNEDNNKNMDKMITNQKIFELHKLFGDKINIINAKREFKAEESLKVFLNQESRSVIVYFLTDLVLVTEREDIVQQKSTLSSITQKSSQQQQLTQYKLLKYIHLDQNSTAQELEDTYNIRYLFRLIGKNETITFISDNEENKLKFVSYINNLIEELKSTTQNRFEALLKQGRSDGQKVKHPISVKCLGTQEVYETTSKTFTQYIIQVEIANIFQNIYLRFKEFKNFTSEVKRVFPHLKLPYIKDQIWTNNRDVTVIENRKLSMMDFLQTLLTSDEMEKSGAEILKQIGLPVNFYQLPSLLVEQDQIMSRAPSINSQLQQYKFGKKSNSAYNNTHQMLRTSSTSSIVQNYFQQSEQKQKQSVGMISPRGPIRAVHNEEDIQASTQRKTTMQNSGSSAMVKAGSRSNSQNRKFSATKLTRHSNPSLGGSIVSHKAQDSMQSIAIKITIPTFPKPTDIDVNITPDTRGGDVFEDVMMQVGLVITFDFKLYIQEKVGQRPIDDDEILWTLLIEKQQSQQSTKDKLTSMMKKVKQYIYSYNHKPVLLRKHLFLPLSNETEYYQDRKRVELISSQIFADIASGSLKLNDTEYTMSVALRFFIEGIRDLSENNIPMDKIKECLPPTVFKQINRDNWIHVLPSFSLGFESEVNTIMEYNKKMQEESLKTNNTDAEATTNNNVDRHRQISERLSMDSEEINHNNITMSDNEDIEDERVHIGQLVFLKVISQTQFYGLKLFEVTPDKDTRYNLQKICKDQFRQHLKTLSKSAQTLDEPQIAGVKLKLFASHDSLLFYSDYKQARASVTLTYDDIQQIQAYPLSLVLHLQPQMLGTAFQINKQVSLHFDTGQSFVIQMLIEEYKKLLCEFE